MTRPRGAAKPGPRRSRCALLLSARSPPNPPAPTRCPPVNECGAWPSVAKNFRRSMWLATPRERVGDLPLGVDYMPKPWQPLNVLIAANRR